MAETRTLEWPDIEPAAREAFSIWVGQPELHWARQAWNLIVRAGLASYSGELERCRVGIRFLALGALYHDFCRIAWDESVPPEYEEWAGELEITPFRVGQLVGEQPDWDDDVDEQIEDALRFLANSERSRIFRALCDGFGGTSALFVSLWRSSRDPLSESRVEHPSEADEQRALDFGTEPDAEPDEEADEEAGEETDDEILNDVTAEKMAGFEWVEGGCEAVD
jgi:hypothetical protein